MHGWGHAMLYSKKARSFIYDELPLDCEQMQYPWVGKMGEQKTASYRNSTHIFLCVWLPKVEENMWGERCLKRDDEIHGERRVQNGSAFEGNDTSRDAEDLLVSRVLQKIGGVSPASLGIRVFSSAAMKISCFSKKSFLKAAFPLMPFRPKKIRSPKRKTRPLLWSLITKFWRKRDLKLTRKLPVLKQSVKR